MLCVIQLSCLLWVARLTLCHCQCVVKRSGLTQCDRWVTSQIVSNYLRTLQTQGLILKAVQSTHAPPLETHCCNQHPKSIWRNKSSMQQQKARQDSCEQLHNPKPEEKKTVDSQPPAVDNCSVKRKQIGSDR